MTKVTVLGLNGHMGRAAAVAFADAGHAVTGLARSDKRVDPRVAFVAGDAGKVEDLRAAIGDSEIVVNCLNLPYHTWDNGRLEAQMARVLEAMGASGKTLLFPGNIYNYAASEREITPSTPQNPETPRGAIRVRVEAQIRAAARRGEIRAVIVRFGDFFGPGNSGDWFDLALLREAGKGRVATLGRAGTRHAWAYLPDAARSFVRLVEKRHDLAAFETFHFAGHFVTPEEMGAAIQRAAPVPLKVVGFPWLVFSLMGLASPMIREVGKMRYLWENPMALRDDRLDALLGPDFGTPFETAVAASVAQFFPAMTNAA